MKNILTNSLVFSNVAKSIIKYSIDGLTPKYSFDVCDLIFSFYCQLVPIIKLLYKDIDLIKKDSQYDNDFLLSELNEIESRFKKLIEYSSNENFSKSQAVKELRIIKNRIMVFIDDINREEKRIKNGGSGEM